MTACRNRTLIVMAFLGATSAAIALAARDAPQSPQVRVTTRLVQFGVIARDKDGPVQDLTKDDFIVLDQGKPRQITVFSIESSDSTAIPQPAKLLPPNTFSDLPQYGAGKPRSVTIVLLDNLNTLYGSVPESQYERTPFWIEDLALQRAKTHLIEFIKTLDPRDRVAVYGLRDSLRVLSDFTNDRDQLLAILSKYDASSATNRAVVQPGHKTIPATELGPDPFGVAFENEGALALAGMANEARDTETMAALQAIAAHVANIPGRKNLVWLTANLPFSGAAMARLLSPANIAVYPIDARGLLPRSTSLQTVYGTAPYDDVSGASGHGDNMPAASSQPIGIPAMTELANETGGEAFVNTNDITGAIRKAVEDSAVIYTLGFYLDASSLDDKFHEIKLQSKRQGLKLRHPKGYFAYREAAATEGHNQQVLLTSLRSPVASSLIPLEARVDRVAQPEPNSLNLACTIDIRNIRLAQDGGLRKGAVTVYTIEQDATGKVIQKWDRPFNLQFTDGQYAALLKTGMLFHQTVHLRAGTTTLRLLVEDPSTSNVGSLIIPLSEVK